MVSGSFEVFVVKANESKEIYSKNQTKAFPDAKQLAEAVNCYMNKGQLSLHVQ